MFDQREFSKLGCSCHLSSPSIIWTKCFLFYFLGVSLTETIGLKSPTIQVDNYLHMKLHMYKEIQLLSNRDQIKDCQESQKLFKLTSFTYDILYIHIRASIDNKNKIVYIIEISRVRVIIFFCKIIEWLYMINYPL